MVDALPTTVIIYAFELTLGDACGKGNRFQQRVTGQTVCTVHTGAGALPDSVEAGECRFPPRIGTNATHKVVSGGCDRNRLTCYVDSITGAGVGDRWKATSEEIYSHLSHVEVGAGFPAPLRLEKDRTRDDVPGS